MEGLLALGQLRACSVLKQCVKKTVLSKVHPHLLKVLSGLLIASEVKCGHFVMVAQWFPHLNLLSVSSLGSRRLVKMGILGFPTNDSHSVCLGCSRGGLFALAFPE